MGRILNTIFIVLALTVTNCLTVSVDPDVTSNSMARYLLATHVVPYKYLIYLDVDFKNDFSFFGKVSIYVRIDVPTSEIKLHANRQTLNITALSIQNVHYPRFYNVSKITYDDSYQFMTLKLPVILKRGDNLKLSFEYLSKLNENHTSGFYVIKYFDNDEERYLASTVFEPIFARNVFPCFDEPHFKSYFTIAIRRPVHMMSLSNMPLSKTTIDGGKRVDYFQESIMMSTYLVTFAIGQFDTIHMWNNSIQYKLYAKNNTTMQNLNYYLENSFKLNNFYENYFNINYKLPKQDLLFVSESFKHEALENWGLISINDRHQINSSSNLSDVVHVTRLLAHELGHNWVGNLVSIKYWNHIWITEGLTNYYTGLALDHIQPNWRFGLSFAARSMRAVMRIELNINRARPLNLAWDGVNTLSLFNHAVYEKSFCIFRMLNYTLEEASFKRSIKHFLQEYQFRSFVFDDLAKIFTQHFNPNLFSNELILVDNRNIRNDSSHIDFKIVLHSWVVNPGYPIVYVIRGYETKKIFITQEKFQKSKNKVNDKTKWWIPLSFFRENSTKDVSKVWFDPNQSLLVLQDEANSDEWVIFNYEYSGLYSVLYDLKNYKLITNFINSKNYSMIPMMNRVQLLNDLVLFVKNKIVSEEILLNFLKYFQYEDDNIAWSNFSAFYNDIRSIFDKSVYWKDFQDIILNISPIRTEQEWSFDRTRLTIYSNGLTSDDISKLARLNINITMSR